MQGLIVAWLVESALVGWRSHAMNNRPPFPSELINPALAYAALGVMASYQPAAPAAAVIGWGLVAATFLNLYEPIKPSASNPSGTNPAGAGLSKITSALGSALGGGGGSSSAG